MREIAQNGQMRAITLAVVGAIVAAAATMFVPTAILETITESTGLSEIVHATAAPLGDTARALIAFGTGVLTLAVLAVFLSRGAKVQPRTERAPAPIYDMEEPANSLLDRLPKIALPKLALPKMPWVKGDDDITELSDLPKLRGTDAHPDAPPRRPLIATQDLPELDLAAVGTQLPEWVEPEVSEVASPVEAPAAEPVVAAAVAEPEPIAPVYVAPAAPAPIAQTAADHQPTLAEMVAQLEAAVAQRHQQLVALEATASSLTQSEPAPAPEVAAPATEVLPPEPVRTERPPLEAVPSSRHPGDDMDAALSAALETLRRMNAAG